MKAFKRVLPYLWSQWQRIVLICICAVIVAIFYVGIFATVSPLLTVMMGSEGLHGWTNRKVSQIRYGFDIYVPSKTDYSDPNNLDLAHYLRITKIKRNGLAGKAGLKAEDKIIGITGALVDENNPKSFANELLRNLQNAPPKPI